MSSASNPSNQWEPELEEQFSDPEAGKASDQDMMEAPDSPPEQQAVFSPTYPPQPAPNSSQQAHPSRTNGDNGAKVNFGNPGSSWQTKKFNDEYDRADAQLLDKNWEPKYGDPLRTNP